MKKILVLILACLPALVDARGAAFVQGRVISSAAADGSGADAGKYAGVTLVRDNIPGEFAIQLAGADKDMPTRIFAPLDKVPYYLSDAGSQWSTGLAVGQRVMAVVETYAPQHTWSGEAYAGAVSASLVKGDYITGMLAMPDAWLSVVPRPELAFADPTHIELKVGSFIDHGGRLDSLFLWRRDAGSSGSWQWLASVNNPSASGFSVYDDHSVIAEAMYEYSVTLSFSWPGGGGVGSMPGTNQIYSTHARSNSGVLAASLKQPTPTPTPVGPAATPTPFEVPDGCIAFPNPARGEALSVVFIPEKQGDFSIRLFSVSGEAVLERVGKVEKPGRMRVEAGIKGLGAGVYLMRVKVRSEDGSEQVFPMRKIAIIH